MAKLSGDIIKAGLHVWVNGYRDGELFPLEVVILDGKFDDLHMMPVVPLVLNTNEYIGVHRRASDDVYVISLADDGIRPYNYDNRCTQVFTTKEEMQAAIDSWHGGNPSDYDEEGNTIVRYKMDWSLDYDDYYE